MPVDLVIAPEAELDIAEAYVWYEGRRAGLGEEFLSSVDACLESIRRRPFRLAPVWKVLSILCSSLNTPSRCSGDPYQTALRDSASIGSPTD
jgi:hypothetical protein